MARTPYHKAIPDISNPFDQILKQGISNGILPGKTVEARNWYRSKASQTNIDSNGVLAKSQPSRFRQRVEIGRMYMFFYDPKTKEKLPYYDRFPLIFPFDENATSFLGLNLHYLPPSLRAKLMDGLYGLVRNNRFDNTTKLDRLTYSMLKNASELSLFRPCVKRYLKTHVRSRFIAVSSNEWDIALFLPTESFEKATKQKVWSDSKNKVDRGRPMMKKAHGRGFNPFRR